VDGFLHQEQKKSNLQVSEQGKQMRQKGELKEQWEARDGLTGK
jgi:hypothetical protein